ncbi:MAG: ferrochelatase [Proteobacteria bacterium]|nr:ferrochelatase [Pseudomonadota bacterium]
MLKTKPKLGVLITNLGSPAAPNTKSVRTYLKQFLSDKRVIQPVAGRLTWWLLLHGIILNTRPKKTAKLYQTIWNKFGDGAPLINITNKQLSALKKYFKGSNVTIAMAMRYGNPSIQQGIDELLKRKVDKLIILPLYPQYSRTTTESTFDVIHSIKTNMSTFPNLKLINNYHNHTLYIAALKQSILRHQTINGKPQKLIISYHGIPKIYVENGDIYQNHCEQTTKLLVAALRLSADEYMICYQSIFGKLEWIKPYLYKTLQALPPTGITNVQVICPGFAADCLETLEEIEHENKNYFLQAGGGKYSYIPALNDSPEHIECLAQIIKDNLPRSLP